MTATAKTKTVPSIDIPYKYGPREYQIPGFQAFDAGIKRHVWVWHRRGGKDKSGLNITIREMFKRKGAYFHFFPTAKLGRKILWEGMDKDGFKFMDHFPPGLVESKNETEMRTKTKNGALHQIIGTDSKIDLNVGVNPVGCVFSEYSIMDPRVWDLVRPILRENNGWALFLYTPRGRNHGYALYEMAKRNADWFTSLLTVDDTRLPDGRPVITPEDIEAERREGMPEELIRQEYYCSFEGYQQGSYFSHNLKAAEAEGRIANIPWEPELPVHTVWDLGVGDANAIWFVQTVGKEKRFIDYYVASGEGLPHYVNVLNKKQYVYGTHYAPHDIKVREYTTGKARYDVARSLGVRFKVVEKYPLEDQIEAARNIFSSCWFDREKCKHGLDALSQFHKEYDPIRKEYSANPAHDWSSHGASAFMLFAAAQKRPRRERSVEELDAGVSPVFAAAANGWMG